MNMYGRTNRWTWIGGIGLGLILIGVGTLVLLHKSSHNLSVHDSESESKSDSPPPQSSSLITDVEPAAHSPTLPTLEFPPNSVEAACGLNEYPPRVDYYEYDDNERYSWVNNPFNDDGDWVSLELEECKRALEMRINTINPYLWGATYENRQFAFVVINNPLTFKRIFTDPLGDLARVQDALSRTECLIVQSSEDGWQLKESCHADAMLNFALVNRFCFDEGIRNRSRQYYRGKDAPTPEQDRYMWTQALEGAWVSKKCEELDSTLDFTAKHHKQLRTVIQSLHDPDVGYRTLQEQLIELAARLGDDAAGLTQRFSAHRSHTYQEEGYRMGRFAELLLSQTWKELATRAEPSVERFHRLLPLFSATIISSGTIVELDLVAVAQHLCTPPYPHNTPEISSHSAHDPAEAPSEPKSCRTIVNDLRLQVGNNPTMLSGIATFEDIAMRLEVYD